VGLLREFLGGFSRSLTRWPSHVRDRHTGPSLRLPTYTTRGDSLDIADVLTSAYQRVAATEISDLALWDLYAATNADSGIEGWAPNYQELGRDDLGPPVLRQRLTEWMSLARRRLH